MAKWTMRHVASASAARNMVLRSVGVAWGFGTAGGLVRRSWWWRARASKRIELVRNQVEANFKGYTCYDETGMRYKRGRAIECARRFYGFNIEPGRKSVGIYFKGHTWIDETVVRYSHRKIARVTYRCGLVVMLLSGL